MWSKETVPAPTVQPFQLTGKLHSSFNKWTWEGHIFSKIVSVFFQSAFRVLHNDSNISISSCSLG